MNGIGWLERLTQDVRVTLRMIRRSPGFALAAIATLALGIGATTAVFTVVNGILIRPLPYPEPDRLVGVWHSAQFQGITSNNIRFSSTMYLTYREQTATFAEFGVWRVGQASVTGRGDPEQVPTLVVTYGTLPAVGVRPALGRWFSAGGRRGRDTRNRDPDPRILAATVRWQRGGHREHRDDRLTATPDHWCHAAVVPISEHRSGGHPAATLRGSPAPAQRCPFLHRNRQAETGSVTRSGQRGRRPHAAHLDQGARHQRQRPQRCTLRSRRAARQAGRDR